MHRLGTKPTAEEGYVAMLYVRQNSPDPESGFTCVVESNALGVPIASKISLIQHDVVRCRLRISNDQLEKLNEVATQSDGESQPPTQYKLGITVTTNDSKVASTIPFSIRGQPGIQAGAIDKLFVADAIHTGMLAMLSLSPSRLFEQTIVWNTSRGHDVPVLVTLETVVVKRLEDEQPTYAIGKGFRDTQLAWLSFDSGKSVPANQEPSIHSPKEIKNFIDEGEQKAKLLGQ